MTPRTLTATLLATALAATPLAAQQANPDDVIVVPVEPAEGAAPGMGGFTASQGLAAVGALVLLGVALGSGGDGDSSNGTD